MKRGKVKKVIIGVAAAVAVVVVTGGAGFSIYVGKQVAEGILYQNEGNDTKQNSIEQLNIWNFDLEGFEKEHPSEQFVLASSDGVQVPVTYFDASDTSQSSVVVLVHGAGGDHVADYPLAKYYLESGWDVLTYDQRGHGDNSDPKVTFGYYEKRDIECLVDYADKTLKADRIVVHGQSMGAATASLYATTEQAKEMVDAIILDSPLDSMEHMFLGVWREMDGTQGIPEDYVMACGDWYLKQFFGFSFADANYTNLVKKDQVKTLVIQSKYDELTSVEAGETLYDNIGTSEKEFYLVDSRHVEGIIDDPDGYMREVFKFIDE